MQAEFTPAQIERFWARVNRNLGCWEWIGYRLPKGYGAMYLAARPRLPGGRKRYPAVASAHRFSWELHNGPIPAGLHVLHKCDNPPCVRPDHLWLGTNGDNVRDMVAKGRGNHQGFPGESHPVAKLTEHRVETVRARFRAFLKVHAEEYGVTTTLIRSVILGRAWKHSFKDLEPPSEGVLPG